MVCDMCGGGGGSVCVCEVMECERLVCDKGVCVKLLYVKFVCVKLWYVRKLCDVRDGA